MLKFKTLLAVIALSIATTIVGVLPAQSATKYYWENTGITKGSVVLGFCNGDRAGYTAISSTGKNVCRFKAMYARHYYVYVAETGTTLFDHYHCTDDTWYGFNSSTDTSRHAVVRVTDIRC